MTLRIDLLQGIAVSHGTEASCVPDLTFGRKARTRLREPRRAHQTHELASCVPTLTPPAHVCAAELRRRAETGAQSRQLAIPLVEAARETF